MVVSGHTVDLLGVREQHLAALGGLGVHVYILLELHITPLDGIAALAQLTAHMLVTLSGVVSGIIALGGSVNAGYYGFLDPPIPRGRQGGKLGYLAPPVDGSLHIVGGQFVPCHLDNRLGKIPHRGLGTLRLVIIRAVRTDGHLNSYASLLVQGRPAWPDLGLVSLIAGSQHDAHGRGDQVRPGGELDTGEPVSHSVQGGHGQIGPVGHPDHGGVSRIIHPAHHAGTAGQHLAQHAGIHVAGERRIPHPGGGGHGHVDAHVGREEAVLAGILQHRLEGGGNAHPAGHALGAASGYVGIKRPPQPSGWAETQRPLQGLEDVARLNGPPPGIAGLLQGALADGPLHHRHGVPHHAHLIHVGIGCRLVLVARQLLPGEFERAKIAPVAGGTLDGLARDLNDSHGGDATDGLAVAAVALAGQ